MSVVNVENETFDFHVHEQSDELFYMNEGYFHLNTDEGLIKVEAGEFIVVPKGKRHRPVVNKISWFLLIEPDGTLNRENSGELFDD